MSKIAHFQVLNSALKWITNNSLPESGIKVTSKALNAYPEVTGYLIPSLINWGERELALQYGNWLVEIQEDDGSFFDPSRSSKCLFDTGQIIRGFIALSEIGYSSIFNEPLKKAVNWIASLVEEDGNIPLIPEETIWGGAVNPAITLYALEPTIRGARIVGCHDHIKKFELATKRIIENPNSLSRAGLNHFHAYVIEALVDLGFHELASKCMEEVEADQNLGQIPAIPGESWICSTGQFQYSVIWRKLGMHHLAEASLNAGASFQNRSGGWFGAYTNSGTSIVARWTVLRTKYFSRAEIPWANKYYLDAMSHKLIHEFDAASKSFSDTIDDNDGRLICLLEFLSGAIDGARILDAGAGKGRYLKHISDDKFQIHALDISEKVMSGIPPSISKATGSLTNIPFPDGSFDLIFAIESLEHAVNIRGALSELKRVLAPQGKLLIIDKNSKRMKAFRFKLPEWETWFTKAQLHSELTSLGFEVEIVDDVSYENGQNRLFSAWVAVLEE